MTDTIALRLIKAALKENKILSIDTDYTLEPFSKTILDFIEDYYKNSKILPELKIVEEKFGIVFSELDESFDYISERFLERQTARLLEKSIKDQHDAFNSRNFTSVISNLETTLEKVKKHSSTILSYKQTSTDRFDTYKKIKAGLLDNFIPTPWPSLNSQIKGWVDGTVNTILGTSETGKSWFICICVDSCSLKQKKSLLVTTEMAPDRIARRLDVVKFKLPFKDLRDGELDLFAEQQYEKDLTDLKVDPNYGEVIIAGKRDARTVKEIEKLVFKYQPDIVFVDGGYRLHVEGTNSVWETQYTLMKQCQEAAETTNIPWVLTGQLWDDDEKSKGSGGATTFKRRDKVKYGKEWIIDPDVALSLRQDEDLKLIEKMEIMPLKTRDNFKGKETIIINWNTNTMDYTEVPTSQSIESLPDSVGDLKPVEF